MGRGVDGTLRGRLKRIKALRQRGRSARADEVEPAAGVQEVAVTKRSQANTPVNNGTTTLR